MWALFCKPSGASPRQAQQGWLRSPGQSETLLLNYRRHMGGLCCRRVPDSGRARKGRADISSLLGLFLYCKRLFAQGNHRVFWNCGEAQAEVVQTQASPLDQPSARASSRMEAWEGGGFPAEVISWRTKEGAETKFDLWMVRAGQPGMVTWRSFLAGSPPRQGACHGGS